MQVLTYVALGLDLLVCVVLIAIVVFQSGKSAGLSGAIAGAADSFMAKGKASTLDAKLAKATKWVAAVFVVMTLLCVILISHNSKASTPDPTLDPNVTEAVITNDTAENGTETEPIETETEPIETEAETVGEAETENAETDATETEAP